MKYVYVITGSKENLLEIWDDIKLAENSAQYYAERHANPGEIYIDRATNRIKYFNAKKAELVCSIFKKQLLSGQSMNYNE